MPLDDTTPIDLDLFDNLDVFNSGGTSGHTEANPSVDMVEYQYVCKLRSLLIL